MKRIESLTPEQATRLTECRAEYFRHGTNCAPADRPRAEAAFARAYRTIGREPVPVIWVDSPLTASLAFAALEHLKIGEGTGKDISVSLVASLRASLGDSLVASLEASLRASLGDSLVASLRASLGASLTASLGASLRDSLGASLGDRLWNSLWANLTNRLWNSLTGSLGNSLTASLMASLRDSLRDSLGDSLRDSKITPRYTYWWGQQDLYWIAFYKFGQELGASYDQCGADRLDIMHEIAMSCMWWYPRDGLIIACERHLALHFDERERPHNDDGPAIEFRDGWKLYSVHGVRMPAWVFEEPKRLTIQAIEAEENTEIQRVMIERFGWERYAEECGAEVLEHDERYGTLYGRNGTALFVKVINGSPEPDGTFRQYVLPVFPNCEPIPDDGETEIGNGQELTALNAVASTYGMTGAEYAAILEART